MHNKSRRDNNELICQLEDNARFAIVGLGGVGCVLLRYLAIFLHSLHAPFRLSLIDGDDYTYENATRQTFGQLGNKAEVQSVETLDLLGNSRISVVAVPEWISRKNVAQLLQCDYLFMCVDNHGVRRIVSEYLTSSNVHDIVLFSGGNDGVDPPRERGSYGSVQIYAKRHGKELCQPILTLHPEIANADVATKKDGESCGVIVQSVPQILFTNLAVASAMLNAFLAYTCDALNYSEVKLDTVEARMLPYFSFTSRT